MRSFDADRDVRPDRRGVAEDLDISDAGLVGVDLLGRANRRVAGRYFGGKRPRPHIRSARQHREAK